MSDTARGWMIERYGEDMVKQCDRSVIDNMEAYAESRIAAAKQDSERLRFVLGEARSYLVMEGYATKGHRIIHQIDGVLPKPAAMADAKGEEVIDHEIPVHPVQTRQPIHSGAKCPQIVTLRAYEVYKRLFGEQRAMVEGNCRGGFGAGELIGFLYAHTFPEKEWRERFDEALRGME